MQIQAAGAMASAQDAIKSKLKYQENSIGHFPGPKPHQKDGRTLRKDFYRPKETLTVVYLQDKSYRTPPISLLHSSSLLSHAFWLVALYWRVMVNSRVEHVLIVFVNHCVGQGQDVMSLRSTFPKVIREERPETVRFVIAVELHCLFDLV